jgi:hypothetical protein
MAPDRQDQLTKAAEDCIDLINIGVEPNAALTKVAEDHIMNDKEVTLVSHAVNNARQLAHIQDNKDDERIAPLVLTNAEEVLGLKTKEQVASTSDKLEAKTDMKDAVDTKKTLDKTAHLKLANTRKRTEQVKKASVSASAVVTEHPTLKAEDPDIFDKLAEYSDVLEEARRTSNNAKDLAFAGIEKIANSFRSVTAPKFAEFEKIAKLYEISDEIIDMIYEVGNLEELGHKRDMEKVASARVYTSTEVKRLVEDCVHVDTNYKTACDYLAAYEMLKEQRASEVADFIKKAKEDSGLVPGYSQAVETFIPDKESFSNAEVLPYKLTGLGSRGDEAGSVASGIFNTDLDAEIKEPIIKHEVRQSIENSKARSNLENLLRDRVVGSFPITDVVDSYNRAISINPKFGEAELTAFIRHDLSSGGNVPLDLMIKATKSHSGANDAE